jgi:hypothetical protein
MFVNKVLLEHCLAHSFAYCLWLLSAVMAELYSDDGDNKALKPVIFILLLFTE